MPTVLHSFADLAKVMGCKKKAKKVVEMATFQNIETKCGRKAAVIWAFLNDQEACKRYGAKGEILHDLEQLKAVTGYEESTIIGSAISLARNGFAKFTQNGQYMRAA